jgi:hypothetical protein
MFSVSLREGAGIDACSIYDGLKDPRQSVSICDGLESVVSVAIRDGLESVVSMAIRDGPEIRACPW